MYKTRIILVMVIILVLGPPLQISANEGPSANYDKVIYLTFDDGPSSTTNTILDILDDNDIKATFFIIGCKIKGNENVIRRIKKEGHSIGLHSYTHKCRKIYSDKEDFIKEMYMTRDALCKITGEKYNVIRFPSGSKGHLNENMLEILHLCNFRTYDWNMSVSDGINYKIPPYRLFREATSKKKKPNTIFMLMHCDQPNKNTCEALQNIIDYYRNDGYTFQAIKDETREFYFPFSKK
ncbi:polysaccharide deacetylase family protein [Clostridium oryzae]|uniref:Peptidoglycan-N-acetylglucosamine deacetylase n=1 Tax=Clostridium oryzae TaxID=1450648 RepID=A0A1V4IS60_9CLOT|nr:polysaccharide deacetylase family protein [Clostridium oryzae]OPJ62743.1 peptidoglycan-N-acetylglucosamine deacetylase [Clostridium oryzae]